MRRTPLALAFLAAVALAAAFVSLPSALTAPAREFEPETIAPGLVYRRHEKDGVIAHVLKLDLKSKDVQVRSIKARGKETIRQLVERCNNAETLVVGGINGDFFRQETHAGIPYGVQVSDGRLLFAPMRRSMIGFGPDNEPYIGVVSLKAKISFAPREMRGPPARWTDVTGVNEQEKPDQVAGGVFLYTPSYLELELRRPRGLIAVIESVEPAFQVGDVCEGTIARMESADRSVEVPEAGCLLYFVGNAARQLGPLGKPGQPVGLKIELPPIAGGVAQAIGGGPRLIRDGKKGAELNREEFDSGYALELSQRHPRSGIGYDRAKQNLFLVMVEGRHARSRGMTFTEMANFLGELGCWQAMAFDGGGSAGMYVAGKGLVTRSMGGFGWSEERPLANGLLVTAPRNPGAKKAATPGGKKAAPKGATSAAPGSQ